ncbi:MAG: hypothetical protein PVH88_11830 [Ignavibacteria bacterium]|jgi:sugar phosphate isomerase/epimerase
MNQKNKSVLGVTLFSFTNEWQQRKYDLEGMIAEVAKKNLGPAIEIVGFQSFREFPDVTDEVAKDFRNIMDRYEMIPSCLGANLDIGIYKNRVMTSDEMVEYAARQITSAKKLGFPVLRIQTFAKPDTLGKLIPIAEKAGVHLASELHSPLTIDNPDVIELLEYYQKIQSTVLGFIPDFSSSMNTVPELFWKNLQNVGASEELINRATNIWHMKVDPKTKFEKLHEACKELNAPPAVAGQINMSLTMFGNMPVEGWQEIIPYAKHIHGKFYEVNDEGIEPSIPYTEIMHLLKTEGFNGTISAEWEGQAFTEEPIGFQQVEAWHNMCKKLLAD